ncbi:MAG: cysteine desulfurase family protein [Alphaproteobacteria bacterium]
MDVYLDYNATAILRPEVITAMQNTFQLFGNSSSVHRAGRKAKSAIEEARERIASVVEVSPAEIIFTSGGTESNNLALSNREIPVFISATEHDSINAVREDSKIINVDVNGIINLEHLEELLSSADRLSMVSVMLANNETGVLQPIQQVVNIARRFGAIIHCDAVQGLGKIPFTFSELGVDMLSISAHKIGGPKGVGALIVKEGIDLPPLLLGGGQERNRRAGTENVTGICGFGVAASLVQSALKQASNLESMRNKIEFEVKEKIPEVTVYGHGVARLPNTSCIGLPDMSNESQIMALDLAGVYVSAGSACSSGKITPSHVLKAMGFNDNAASSAIRVSLGWQTTENDCNTFISVWTDMVKRIFNSNDLCRSVA